MTRAITPGDHLVVKDAFGQDLPRIATSGVDPGDEFAVVWACREEEWNAAQAEGREPNAMPWPLEDVALAGEPVGA